MITGVETAGLVLAAFPLIFQACDQYRKGCEPLKDWWRFRLILPKIVNAARVQETLFRQNLQKLLLPLLDSKEDVERLCEDLESADWHSPDLEEALHEQLGKNVYQQYFALITEMSEVMEKVKDKLNVKILAVPSTSDMASQIDRVKISLKKRTIQELLNEFGTHVKILEKLLKNSNELRTLTHARKPRVGRLLGKIRDSATSLFNALQHGWGCDCSQVHKVHLALEERPGRTEDVKRKPEEYQPSFAITLNQEGSTKWQETRIDIVEVTRSIAQSPAPGTINHGHKFKKKVGFQMTSPQACAVSTTVTQTTITTNDIKSLCAALATTPKVMHLGCLPGSDGYKHSITLVSQQQASLHYVSLADILGQHRFNPTNGHPPLPAKSWETPSREQRYKLAVVVASTVLQLHSTPWLSSETRPSSISSSDIFFPSLDSSNMIPMHDSDILSKPFLIQRPLPPLSLSSFPSLSIGSSPNAPSLETQTRRTLLRLAITLLELCFGSVLTNQPFYTSYFGPNNLPHDQTDHCAAIKWSDSVLGEGGPQFAEAVGRLLDCGFGFGLNIGKCDLGDEEFRQAVWDGVVEPLREVVAVWRA